MNKIRSHSRDLIPMKAPFIFCAIMLAFASCKKEKTTLNNNTIPPESTTENPYQPLNEGNYWVYERYHVFLNDSSVATGIIDTCYVGKDTMILNQLYHTYIDNNAAGYKYTNYLRDSLSFIVNNFGFIVFSSSLFYQILNSTYYVDWSTTSSMTDIGMLRTVPKGTFTTLNYKTQYTTNDSMPIGLGHTFHYDHRYAKDVGIVEETIPGILSDTFYTVHKLLDYHLE